MTRRTMLFATATTLVLAGLVGAACGVSGGGGTVAGPAASPALGPAVGGAPPMPNSYAGAGPAKGDSARALSSQVPALQQRVVKTAMVDLTLRDGTFDARFQQASQIAAQNGGYVSSSQTAGRRAKSGTVILRVPVAQFESALGELKSLGRVSSVRVSGQDVTAQFVDLQARLRNWQAQEGVLLGLMKRSTSVLDSIRVEQQLQDVQLNIEEITGQLRVLNDQADLSTITVTMSEPGAAAPPRAPSSLSKAWHQALHGAVAVVAAVVVGLGYLAPFAVLAIVLALAVGFARRQRLRVTPPQPTA